MLWQNRIVTLMFHRINDASIGYQPDVFARYLDYLTQHFPIVLPGDSLDKKKINICLTFDDGYYDFYQDVFPLLKQYQVKAILAVPAKYIVETAHRTAQERLSVPYAHDMDDPTHQANQPFCSWQELREMSQTGLVNIAAHGYRHANLRHQTTDFHEEIVTTKELITDNLGIAPRFFVYPFGAMSPQAHQLVKTHYEFGIRIGSTLNYGWDNHSQFVYRINADPFWLNQRPITPYLCHRLAFKYWVNRLRNK
jgi:peptidoglycan/xylan/chitin deacetylase (PgdA/CDA1 family)